MNAAVVVTKLDPQTKKAAMKTASDLGMPLSVVIKAFLKQFIRTKSISLSIDNEVPNKYLVDLLKQSEEEFGKGQVVSFKAPKEELAYIDKQFKSAPLEIKIAFREARELLIENPNANSLRDHTLKEKYSGYRSIDVTDDYRAIYKERRDGNQKVITFPLLGTHNQLYG